ncbi:MAG: c-type cytochrome domain-containing protein [Gemmataceae bacterium]
MRTLIVAACLVCALGADAPPEPAAPSYDKEIDGLMRKYCATCHGKRMPRGGVSVVTYEGLMKSKKGKTLTVPGQPDKSLLVLTMQGHMPVMPPKGTELVPTEQEVARVRAWVAAGAKDDTPE